MNDLDILKKARDIIANQKHHVIGRFVDYRDSGPCFCTFGAIAVVKNGDKSMYTMSNYDDLHYAELFGYSTADSLYCFNDQHTKEEVVYAFDEVIARMERDM